VVPALIDEGRYRYAYLGLSGSGISAELAKALDLPEGQLGVYVSDIIPGGPSAAAGLLGGDEVVESENGIEFRAGGDIITAIDGVPVHRFEDLVSYLVTRAEPGQTVTLTVLREGEEVELTAELGERPERLAAQEPEPQVEPVEPEDEVSAREAIDIAVDAVEESGLLEGEIDEKVVGPGEFQDVGVWVVELRTDTQLATVRVDMRTGEVLDLEVEIEE
jgi:2-alkenal reductase